MHLHGIVHIRVNELTGSVVINYDPQMIQPQDLLNLLTENGYIDETKAISHNAHIQTVAAKAGFKIGRAVFGWALGKAFEGSGLSLLAALI
jgi:hypothetical protein